MLAEFKIVFISLIPSASVICFKTISMQLMIKFSLQQCYESGHEILFNKIVQAFEDYVISFEENV